MAPANEKHPGDKLIAGVKKSATELENLQVQIALGEMEARDKFEEIKKKFNRTISEAKLKTKEGGKKAQEVQAYLEDLQVQLALGKAETAEAFEEQKKKIFRAVNKLDKMLEVNPWAAKLDEQVLHELEKFRIKMEMLGTRLSLGKERVKAKLNEEKIDVKERVAKIRTKMMLRKNAASIKWKHRKEEVKEAYKHLKKAFV
ncbi:MAG TPA: hypothetical protein VFU15_05170 [Bacteroidia bacterium]|nr:hypothetical protein [Bacteroidia bacterium]